jgi:hypothetical protein
MSVIAPAMSVRAPAMSVEAPAMSVGAPAMSVRTPAMSVEVPAKSVMVPAMSVGAPAISVGAPASLSKFMYNKNSWPIVQIDLCFFPVCHAKRFDIFSGKCNICCNAKMRVWL